MSDNYVILIPEDPHHVPARERQQKALERFREIAPRSREIKATMTEAVRFFDCGGNFERILCPNCGADIPVPWWRARMDSDYKAGFPLEKAATPCCGVQHTLHELTYEWPQGFGRFGIEAMNPNIGRLDDKLKVEFEQILGCSCRVIYQHI
ncbi:MAG TPA: hypothetical protein VMS17_04035 [Gemmataceae bacterium]|nr:hypothetical protein [Gemmataceae bacterium]